MPRDYSKHWPPCGCIVCLDFTATCECCNRTFTTYPGYRRHLTAQIKKKKRGPINPPTVAIVPDGLGFLKRITANAANLGTYNLSVISRFCAALNLIRPRGAHARFTRTHSSLFKALEAGDFHDRLLDFKTRLTEAQTRAVLGLAKSVNVCPGDVISLLVSYGLEHLARELRENAVAPPVASPNIEKSLVQKTSTASEEYLQEKYPEAAKKVVQYEHTEYRKPTPVSRAGSGSFPKSKGEDD